MSSRRLKIELTDAQYMALAIAIDDHRQHLVNNDNQREISVLDKGWDKITKAWHTS